MFLANTQGWKAGGCVCEDLHLCGTAGRRVLAAVLAHLRVVERDGRERQERDQERGAPNLSHRLLELAQMCEVSRQYSTPVAMVAPQVGSAVLLVALSAGPLVTNAQMCEVSRQCSACSRWRW